MGCKDDEGEDVSDLSLAPPVLDLLLLPSEPPVSLRPRARKAFAGPPMLSFDRPLPETFNKEETRHDAIPEASHRSSRACPFAFLAGSGPPPAITRGRPVVC